MIQFCKYQSKPFSKKKAATFFTVLLEKTSGYKILVLLKIVSVAIVTRFYVFPMKNVHDQNWWKKHLPASCWHVDVTRYFTRVSRQISYYMIRRCDKTHVDADPAVLSTNPTGSSSSTT